MWQYFAITQNFISCERATKGRKATKGSRYVSIHRCLLSLWWKPSFVSSVWRSWLFFRAAHLLIRPPGRDFLISVSVPSVIKPGFCVRHPSLRPHFFKHFYSLWRESCRASVRCLIFFFFLLLNSFDVAAGVAKGKPGPPGQQVSKSFLIAFVWQWRVVVLMKRGGRQQKPVAKSSLFNNKLFFFPRVS